MKAAVLKQTGPEPALVVEDVPNPVPGAGEVLVRVKAAALNHRDVFIAKGQYAGIRVPAILGSDGAGVIEAVGAGVDKGRIGENVLLNPSLNWGPNPHAQGPEYQILGMPRPGTFAELVTVPATHAIRKPGHMTFEEAGALPLAGLTAFRAVMTRAQVRPGERVLVTGIGGGVSLFACQIALAHGAKVWATSGSDEKLARAKTLGVEGGVNYRSPSWGKELVTLMGGEGPDVIVDGAGGATFETNIDIAAPGGRIVNYGATLGAAGKTEIRRIFWKQLNLMGSTMGTESEFGDLVTFYETRALKPIVDRVFPLSEVNSALQHMEKAAQFGKVALKI